MAGHNINHASNHTDGTDDIQDASASQKGLVNTSAQNFAGEKGFNDGIVMPNASGEGIRLDTTTPAYGWADITGALTIHEPGGGGSDPAYNVWKGNIRAYEFNSVNSDEMFVEFHMPHDYVPGTDIYIHAHWSHNQPDVTTGSVTWSFECTYAKGHDQAAFGTNVIPTVNQAASTTQYFHQIAEVQLSAASPSATQLDSDDLEVDGLILVRVLHTTNTMDGGANPFLHMVDLHYQTTGIPTKNRSPNFYT